MACDPFDITKEVKEIRLPSLLALGWKDRNAPEKYSEDLENKISGSKMKMVDRAGRMMRWEAPDALRRVVFDFSPILRFFARHLTNEIPFDLRSQPSTS
jgi:pimeloyl-ACP methyl ester carboxylesterase